MHQYYTSERQKAQKCHDKDLFLNSDAIFSRIFLEEKGGIGSNRLPRFSQTCLAYYRKKKRSKSGFKTINC